MRCITLSPLTGHPRGHFIIFGHWKGTLVCISSHFLAYWATLEGTLSCFISHRGIQKGAFAAFFFPDMGSQIPQSLVPPVTCGNNSLAAQYNYLSLASSVVVCFLVFLIIPVFSCVVDFLRHLPATASPRHQLPANHYHSAVCQHPKFHLNSYNKSPFNQLPELVSAIWVQHLNNTKMLQCGL